MEIIAKWKHNREYFQQYWKDWVKHRSKGTKDIPVISFFIIILGLFIYFSGLPSFTHYSNHGLTLVLVGTVLITWYMWYKHKWIHSMLQDSDPESENIIIFNENGITTKSLLSSGEANWKIIKEIVRARNGIFLVLQKGISIYIPFQSLQEPNNIRQIIEMYNQQID